MDNFLNTKIFRSKSLDRVVIDPLDIPPIDFSNAILYEELEDSYRKSFSLDPIKRGLIKHNGRYYFFYHDIINKPYIKGQTCHSFNIYPIKNDFAQEMIKNKSFPYWIVKFHSFYYYGEYYLSIGNGNYIKWYKYKSDINDNVMKIPYGISPSSLTEGITVGKFIENHTKQYPKTEEMILNKSIIREQQIFEIFKDL